MSIERRKVKTIDFISLGCSKNLVDSEMLMGLMEANGFHCTHDSDNPQGEIVVINTCGFINDAKEESINTILEFAQAKTEGRIERLYVMGCLSERYLADLEREIPSEVKLESCQSMFPSITKFGMAALLPHEELTVKLEGNGNLSVLADGQSTEAGNRDTDRRKVT